MSAVTKLYTNDPHLNQTVPLKRSTPAANDFQMTTDRLPCPPVRKFFVHETSALRRLIRSAQQRRVRVETSNQPLAERCPIGARGRRKVIDPESGRPGEWSTRKLSDKTQPNGTRNAEIVDQFPCRTLSVSTTFRVDHFPPSGWWTAASFPPLFIVLYGTCHLSVTVSKSLRALPAFFSVTTLEVDAAGRPVFAVFLMLRTFFMSVFKQHADMCTEHERVGIIFPCGLFNQLSE